MSRRKKQNLFRSGQFTPQFEKILRSPAYRDLSCKARCLLLEFERLCFPHYRNGYLSISTYKAAQLLKVNPDTAAKAFRELVEHGFLILRKESMWQERMAREWILTTYPYQGATQPTDDWMTWEPGKPVRNIPKKEPKKAGGNRTRSQNDVQGDHQNGAATPVKPRQTPYSDTLKNLLVVEDQSLSEMDHD